ncbi:hypothetical protein [Sphingomonas sp.]|uniref:hypothetical protein n=1 Tax=Sphingomonas sp. TaxID=28214 RepID=UPI0031D0FB80
MTTVVTRALLSELTKNPRLLQFFEQIFATGQSNASQLEGAAGATRAIQDATVLALSSNAAFNNERIVQFDSTVFQVVDGGPGGTLAITLLSVITTNGGYRLTFNLEADTNLDLPSEGRVLVSTISPAAYADDAAAAAAGIEVGEAYRKTGGTVAWRVA